MVNIPPFSSPLLLSPSPFLADHNFKPQVNLSENNQLTLSFILPAVISELFNLKIR
jgi:hypothetical protein